MSLEWILNVLLNGPHPALFYDDANNLLPEFPLGIVSSVAMLNFAISLSLWPYYF